MGNLYVPGVLTDPFLDDKFLTLSASILMIFGVSDTMKRIIEPSRGVCAFMSCVFVSGGLHPTRKTTAWNVRHLTLSVVVLMATLRMAH